MNSRNRREDLVLRQVHAHSAQTDHLGHSQQGKAPTTVATLRPNAARPARFCVQSGTMMVEVTAQPGRGSLDRRDAWTWGSRDG